jgi:hypothetical protein
MKRIDC